MTAICWTMCPKATRFHVCFLPLFLKVFILQSLCAQVSDGGDELQRQTVLHHATTQPWSSRGPVLVVNRSLSPLRWGKWRDTSYFSHTAHLQLKARSSPSQTSLRCFF